MWFEQRQVRITWDPGYIGGENHTVAIQLARFSMKDGHVVLHSFFTLVAKQGNTGDGQFVVPKGVGQG